MKISSPQQHDGVPQLPPPTQSSPFPQQYSQPPPPVAPPFAPIVDPQYVSPLVPPTGSPYGYPMTNPYGSPSAPPVGLTYTSPGNQSYPSQNFPMPAPFYGQQHPLSPPTWPSPPQGPQQGYPSAPPFPGQYNSPDQLPPPSYQQLFGHSRAQQLPHVPDVHVAAAEAPKEFRVGMKVEAVDRRFPYYVCVATITDAQEKNHEVLIHFDGWSNSFDYWCESDAIELHPMGWCETFGWELQKPQGTYSYT